MSVSDYEQCLRACITQNQHVIATLIELITETEHHHTVCNSVKTGGTAAGLLGTGLMVGSLVAAPFTGGASLLLTASAAACSIGGAATNIITGAVDRSKTKEIIGKMQSLINSRTKMTSKLKEQSDRFSKVIEHLVLSDLSEHTAFYTTFTALANGRFNMSTGAANVSDYEKFVVMGRLIQTEFELFKSLESTSKAVAIVSKTLPGINQMILKSAPMLAEEATRLGIIGSSAMTAGGQALKTGGEAVKAGGQAASGLVKTLATAAVVTSVVVSVVDVAFLIRDWESDHPTIQVISNTLQQLKAETKSFEDLLLMIDSLRERVYLASIDDIPIIGSIDRGNDAMIALLNQDISQCIQILKEIDIDWPFAHTMTVSQLAVFLLQHQAACGFDQQQLDMILQQRGKKARRSILCLVTEIVQKVKEEAESMQRDKKKSKRSNRGEHVINNNVLSVQRNIIDMFLGKRLNMTFGELQRIPQESSIYHAYHNPFDEEIKTNIQSIMVARISDDTLYFDTNALLYGIIIYFIRISARDHMTFFYDNQGAQGSPSTSTLRTSRFLMNQMQTYVDKFALQYWLKHNGGSWTTYEKSQLAVYRMFLNLDDQIRIWVHELKRFGY